MSDLRKKPGLLANAHAVAEGCDHCARAHELAKRLDESERENEKLREQVEILEHQLHMGDVRA